MVAAKRSNSAKSMAFESSASIAWKTASKASRVPSSCRMCAGSPSSSRTAASERQARMISARESSPSLL
eukprot:3466025-Prymnesium_polylepis.1